MNNYCGIYAYEFPFTIDFIIDYNSVLYNQCHYQSTSGAYDKLPAARNIKLYLKCLHVGARYTRNM